jgi:hypothetical protein
MNIVKASFMDLEYILPLVIEYYENDRPDVEVTDTYIIEQTTALLNLEDSCIYAAVVDGEVAGVAGMCVANNMGKNVAQEVFWKVKEGYSKTKAGAKLLKALEEEAVAMNAEAITVVALPGEHQKRVENSYTTRGYAPVCSTYMKSLGVDHANV